MLGGVSTSENKASAIPNVSQRIYEQWSSIREFLYGFKQSIYERWPSVREVLYEWVSTVREFLYGLKVAWVSVASVIFGILLFLVSLQVQDLFLEVKGDTGKNAAFWLLFYLSVMIAWGLPVYVSSRWILSRFEQGTSAEAHPDVKPVPTWVRRWVPPLLTVGCFAAVLMGQLILLVNTPAIAEGTSDTTWNRASEDNPVFGMIGVLLIGHKWIYQTSTLLFAIYIFSAAAIIWLYLHRLLNSISIRSVRVLGKIIWWPITVISIVPVALILQFVWIFATEQWLINFGIGHMALLPALTVVAAYFAWRGLKPNRKGMLTPIGRMLLRFLGVDGIVDEATATNRIIIPFYYFVLFTSLVLFLIALFIHPVHATTYVYRAPMLPVLLGILVAPLTYLSYWSVRSRVPIVFVLILVAATIVLGFEDKYDVRTMLNAQPREFLEQAVNRWAAVNDCDANKENDCPSPFIISVAGGASRSAFHVTGLIGKLMDDNTRIIPKDYQDTVRSAVFSPDGKRIVTTSNDPTGARLWNGKTGRQIVALRGSPPIHTAPMALNNPYLKGNAAFSPDGKRIVTTTYRDHAARLWDGKTGEPIAVLAGHQGEVESAVFSPDGTRIVTTAHRDNTARLWHGKTGEKIVDLVGHSGGVDTAGFSPNGMRIATTSSERSDQIIWLWHGKTGKPIAPLDGHDGYPKKVAFSRDGTRIVTTASLDSTARLWHGKTGEKIADLVGHRGDLTGAAFSGAGDRIVTTSHKDNAARLWHGKTGKPITVLAGHEGEVQSAVFSPDGTRIVTAALGDSIARLWDGKTGEPIAVLAGHRASVENAGFSPDGTRIVTTAYSDRSARLWDGKTGEKIAVLEGHLRELDTAAFSPDGKRIVTTALDNTARLWDGKTGKKIAVLEGHLRRLDTAAFSQDGKRIVTIAWGAALWDLESGSQLSILKPETETRHYQPFSKQLFAVSSVSGGALGGVIAYAALADSQIADGLNNGIGNPPCKKGVSDQDWFIPYAEIDRPRGGSKIVIPSDAVDQAVANGGGRGEPALKEAIGSAMRIAANEVQESWRGCLQFLSAGDFLSPVFVSLLTTDLLQQYGLWGDRAAVLEQAWEMRYAKLTGQSTLGRSLIELRKEVLDKDKKNWLPVLLLNGTSVTTGRRIVTSDVRTYTVDDGEVRKRVLKDAYDLHELLAWARYPSLEIIDGLFPIDREDRDIRLSTAATMSARFPIISPHGNIRDADGEIIDRIVDGGYFENFGAITTAEVATWLEDNFHLKPVIILVNNEPTTSGIGCITKNSTLAYPAAPQSIWFAALRSPFKALFATREARGSHAATDLCSSINDSDRFAFITVSRDKDYPNKSLSMSWWLSKHVQKYLDEQLYPVGYNSAAFRKIDAARKELKRQ